MKKECPTRLHEFFRDSSSAKDYLERYAKHVSSLLADLDSKALSGIVDCFLAARERSSTIFFVGNGGSAATASHFAQDLAEVGRKTGKAIFKTYSLTDNVPTITALANDYGYETIFIRQMEERFRKGDVLVAISASGNSPNIVGAASHAKKTGGLVVGLVGFDGGKLARTCDHMMHVRTGGGEYGPVEDIHMILDHMITTYIMMKDLAGAEALKKA
jgi:D-sedoheptulose 7-phosphate isomerase